MRADSDTMSRRALALLKAAAVEQLDDVDVLAPDTAPALDRLWNVDPLGAAMVAGDEEEVRVLLRYVAAWAAVIARELGFQDALLDLIEQRLRV